MYAGRIAKHIPSAKPPIPRGTVSYPVAPDRRISQQKLTQLDQSSKQHQQSGKVAQMQRLAEKRKVSYPTPKINKTGIPYQLKERFESGFGKDLSQVRVHAESHFPIQFGAKALAKGKSIHFAPGQYRPDTSQGQHVLGHELAHVVQQSEGRVTANTKARGLGVNTQPHLEQQADQQSRSALQLKSTQRELQPLKENAEETVQLWPPESVDAATQEISALELKIKGKGIQLFQDTPVGRKVHAFDGFNKTTIKTHVDLDRFGVDQVGSSGMSAAEIMEAIKEYKKLLLWRDHQAQQDRGFGYGHVPSVHFPPPAPTQHQLPFNPMAPELHMAPLPHAAHQPHVSHGSAAASSSSPMALEFMGQDVMARMKSPEELEAQRKNSAAYVKQGKHAKAASAPSYDPDIFEHEQAAYDEDVVKKWKAEKRGKMAQVGAYSGKKWPDQKKVMGSSATDSALGAIQDGVHGIDHSLSYAWLHMFAFSLGGKDNDNPQDPRNFVLGTQYANNYHLIFETVAKELASEHGLSIVAQCDAVNVISQKWRVYEFLNYSITVLGSVASGRAQKTTSRQIPLLGRPAVHASDKETLKHQILLELGILTPAYQKAVRGVFPLPEDGAADGAESGDMDIEDQAEASASPAAPAASSSSALPFNPRQAALSRALDQASFRLGQNRHAPAPSESKNNSSGSGSSS